MHELDKMDFAHVPYAATISARRVMESAAGTGDRSIDLPFYADTQFPKRVEIAAMLADNTVRAAGQWDNEAKLLDINTPGGKRMEVALSRLIDDHNRQPIDQSKDVRWMARRLVTDIEMQAFAQGVVKAIPMIDDPDQADTLESMNKHIIGVAERCRHHPEETRSMQMQAQGWYESMPNADREDLLTDITSTRLSPNQELYLEALAEPYAKTNGLPKMSRFQMDAAAAYPSSTNLTHASALIDYQTGVDQEPEAHQYFADDPYKMITSAVLSTIADNDRGHSLGSAHEHTREVVALARAMQCVDVANDCGIELTNHDVAAIMLSDIKMMANIDRGNMEDLRTGGPEKVDELNMQIAAGDYRELMVQPLFFPAAFTDASIHISSVEQKKLVTQIEDCGLDRAGRFQYERANDPEQRIARMEMLRSESPERLHEQQTIQLMRIDISQGR